MNWGQNFIVKESQLDTATTEIEEAVMTVKNLAKSVKMGTATKKELENAVKELDEKKRKVEILSAESKILSGWKTPDFSAIPNEKKGLNAIWVLSIAAALYILFAR